MNTILTDFEMAAMKKCPGMSSHSFDRPVGDSPLRVCRRCQLTVPAQAAEIYHIGTLAGIECADDHCH